MQELVELTQCSIQNYGSSRFGGNFAVLSECDAAIREFRFIDGAPASATQGYRQVLVGPEHPYLQGGLAMDFPSVNHGQNDLFVFQARAFLEQVAGVGKLPPVPSFAHGLRNLRLLGAVVESAQNGGVEAAVPTP